MHYKLDKKDVGREGQNTITFLYDWSVINYKHVQNLKDFFPLKQFSMCACRVTESTLVFVSYTLPFSPLYVAAQAVPPGRDSHPQGVPLSVLQGGAPSGQPHLSHGRVYALCHAPSSLAPTVPASHCLHSHPLQTFNIILTTQLYLFPAKYTHILLGFVERIPNISCLINQRFGIV